MYPYQNFLIVTILRYMTGHTLVSTTSCHITDVHNYNSEELELEERKSRIRAGFATRQSVAHIITYGKIARS